GSAESSLRSTCAQCLNSQYSRSRCFFATGSFTPWRSVDWISLAFCSIQFSFCSLDQYSSSRGTGKLLLMSLFPAVAFSQSHTYNENISKENLMSNQPNTNSTDPDRDSQRTGIRAGGDHITVHGNVSSSVVGRG